MFLFILFTLDTSQNGSKINALTDFTLKRAGGFMARYTNDQALAVARHGIASPEAEFTSHDLARKLGLSPRQTRRLLVNWCNDGLAERRQEPFNNTVRYWYKFK